VPDEDVLQRVIYRADLPYRPQHSAIRYPAELNRRPATLAALGPYVSVVGGQQDYVENGVLLSGVQAVGTAAQPLSIRERRLILENLADRLGDLELDLSFSVEATADLGLLVPALRVEAFHYALYESMSMARRAETTGHMLARLRNAIAADLTSVQSVEQRADDRRRVRTAAAVTFVTTVAGTFGLLFGFFGINTVEVQPDRSIFDDRYAAIYLLIAALIVTAATLYLVLRLIERHQIEQDRRWQQRHPAEPDLQAEPVGEAGGRTGRHGEQSITSVGAKPLASAGDDCAGASTAGSAAPAVDTRASDSGHELRAEEHGHA
jgi:hypothetical protein